MDNNPHDNEQYDTEDKDTKSLPDWSNPPSLTNLKEDLDKASPYRDAQTIKINAWLDNLNIEGAAKPKKIDGKSSVAPKLIRKQAEWRYAALSEPFLSTEDIFNIDPVTHEDKEAAKQNQLVLNNQFNTKLNKVKLFDELVRTDVDEGTVIVKTGWDFQEEEREVEEPSMVEIPVTDVELAAELQRQGKPAVVLVQQGTKLVKKMVTTVNKPTVEICDFRNITIDPSCEGDIDKAKFVIHSFQTSKSELEKEGDRYFDLDKIEIDSASPLSTPDHITTDTTEFNFKDKPRKLFIAHEYWGFWDVDGDGKLVPFVATWVGNTLIRLEENPYPDKKLPFVIGQYLPVRKSIYGEPDGALLEDNQKIIGAITRGMIDLLGRNAAGQMGMRKDALDLVNRRKYEKGLDYEFNAQIDPRQAFYTHTFSDIPESALRMVDMQNNDAESLTAVKAFNNGISGQALGSTATGIRSALDATSKRELGILRRISALIIEIGRKIISMNSEFLEDEEVVRVTNEHFVPVRRDDLAGNFDLKLSISTPEADNEKANDISFMLQTIGNNVDPKITNMMLADVAALRKLPRLEKALRDYQPEPDPLAVEKAQLENELLRAKIANEIAKGRENAVDVQLKSAKTETELAKGRNLHSKSDQQDLDFLEQESGLTRQHETNLKDQDRIRDLDNKAADSMLNNEQAPPKYRPLPALG